MRNAPTDTGISVVYEPENDEPVVDIIFVHGLQGHPYRTWASTKAPKPPTFGQEFPNGGKHVKRNALRSSLSRLSRTLSGKSVRERASKPYVHQGPGDTGNSASSSQAVSSPVFWPSDLLPKECPDARILVYGYDTKVTKYMAAPTNQNSIYSHAKDLLFALSRVTVLGRRLIFVAHSLGGIILKEMLAASSTSRDSHLTSIVESTSAVIFLGNPHRGSPDLAALGEWARSFISAFRAETTATILQALGLRNTDLERAQESFSALWQRYSFRVKTFQEALGLTGLNLGVLGNKVVPDYSSSLGDHREDAETIQANHMDMCRFAGPDDPGYRKVAEELRSIYLSLVEARALQTELPDRTRRPQTLLSISSLGCGEGDAALTETERAVLQFLWFPGMHTRRRNLRSPADNTCNWLFETHCYKLWLSGDTGDISLGNGMLWLKGKPGAGKSVLMKEAYRRTLREHARSGHYVAAFFFNAKGRELEATKAGLYRSLLHQLLRQDREQLTRLAPRLLDISRESRVDDSNGAGNAWLLDQLESILRLLLGKWRGGRKSFIFIDAVDECHERASALIHFWQCLNLRAWEGGARLNVLLSSRDSTSFLWPEIVVDRSNRNDIAAYVSQRFRLTKAGADPQWPRLRDEILQKADGVFLWAHLVVEETLSKWEEGGNLVYWIEKVNVLPRELSDLFAEILASTPPGSEELLLRLFQWATLAVRPLRLHEWHHILAFIRRPVPSSLQQWRLSEHFTTSEDQLERQIRTLSRGLLEVTNGTAGPKDELLESVSVCAWAGSLDLENGETRAIQVIHDSVREFFFSWGFEYIINRNLAREFEQVATLGQSYRELYSGLGHVSIMTTCLDYLNIAELDALVTARKEAAQRQRYIEEQDPTPPLFEETAETDKVSREEQCLSPVGLAGIDIMKWIATTDSVVDDTYLTKPDICSPSSVVPDDSVKTTTLEDYPALLLYATHEFFTHARLARSSGVDLQPIVARLRESEIWTRWMALTELNLQVITVDGYLRKQGLGDLSFVATRESLEKQKDDNYIFKALIGQVDETRQPKNMMERSLQDLVTPDRLPDGEQGGDPYSPGDVGNRRAPDNRRLRRRGSAASFGSGSGSVASFSSAGSYTKGTNKPFGGGNVYTKGTKLPSFRSLVEIEFPGALGTGPSLSNTQAGPHRCERINPSTGEPCDMGFSRPLELTLHEHTFHNVLKKQVRCDLCADEKTFSRSDALARHYRVCHPEIERPISDTDDDYIDESAIDDDDDEEWEEESAEESGKSSMEEKIQFKRVDSSANLTSRRSLITLMLANNNTEETYSMETREGAVPW
ncbi:hypothetical protein N656DRAFT_801849 [Canariomyces notabilis]|uniref:NACHT domain-containing protein n=1 Tax=Canariomyces notabilis TaxID=2074819 RepID=A0AAN6QF53_9PEZI|nr:hypothetical protein N656DRAFT_801849 [Canariomyces arenarius]